MNINVDETEINSWIDFYYKNGSKNKEKMHKPIVHTDCMTTKKDTLRIFTKEQFDIKQRKYELSEICRGLEITEDYQKEFDILKEYYNKYPDCRFNKRWYNDKIAEINEKLNSNYTLDDF